jgi:hypothetical protein
MPTYLILEHDRGGPDAGPEARLEAPEHVGAR